MLVRQFSYLGLDAAGQPIPYGLAGNMSVQVLGDRMAVQVEKLYRLAGAPVDIVAESEGTLGLYAMLARHPHLPVRSVVLLSPIVQPGQLGQAGGTVPGAALTTLNNLVGGMSPYGSSGAQELINSVSEVGGRYFERVSRDRGLSWLAVVPLANAVTLPACPMPQNMIFVDAFHGGLLGDPSVQRIVAAFLAGGTPRTRTWTRWRADPSVTCAARPAHRGRGRRLADAGPAPGLPQLLSARPVAGPGAVRYAMPRDENSPPPVVAPPLGGVLTQAVFGTQLHKRPPRNGGRFLVARPPPGPETRGATRGRPTYGNDDPRRGAGHPHRRAIRPR